MLHEGMSFETSKDSISSAGDRLVTPLVHSPRSADNNGVRRREIKRNSRMSHSGKRLGAGRKTNEVNFLRRSLAQGLLAEEQERERWMRFLNSPDEDLAFKAFLAWNDRAYGKPAQAVDVNNKEGITTIIVDI
jgi:hypothetical protein